MIHQRQLTTIHSIIDNPTILEIIIHQIAIKQLISNSWIIATQKLLRKYKIPPLLEIIATNYTKDNWKKIV